jgi:hypothetical protein
LPSTDSMLPSPCTATTMPTCSDVLGSDGPVPNMFGTDALRHTQFTKYWHHASDGSP